MTQTQWRPGRTNIARVGKRWVQLESYSDGSFWTSAGFVVVCLALCSVMVTIAILQA